MRRSERGAALITTVLVAALGASIVLGLVVLAASESRSSAASEDAISARASADAALSSYVSALRDDPRYFARKVHPLERARLCPADAAVEVVQPGETWPASCGPSWEYADPDGTAEARLEITPPSTATSGEVTVLAVGHRADQTAAVQASLAVPTAAAWTVAVDDDLDLADVQPAGSPDGASLYAGRSLAASSPWLTTAASVTMAAEGSVTVNGTAVAPSANVRVYVPDPTIPQLPLRDVAATPLTTNALAASAERTRVEGCSTTAMTAAAAAARTTPPVICLAAGAALPAGAGLAQVPSDARSYLVIPQATGVRLFAATAAPSYPTDGDVYAGSVASVAAGTHPGTLSYWTEIGSFGYPDSGLIIADRDVHVGLCGAGFTSSGCAQSASAASGFTVIAGSVGDPRDVYLSGSLLSPASPGFAAGAPVGLVAFGDVIVPYWAKTRTGTVEVNASVVALGGRKGSFGGSPEAVRALPAARPAALAAGGSFSLRGSIAAPRLDLSTAGPFAVFAATGVTPNPSLAATPPPYMPSYSSTWQIAASSSMAPGDVEGCGATGCPEEWFGTDSGSSDADPTPTPTTPAPPGPPALTVGDSRLTVTFSPSVTSNVTYQVTATRLSDGASVARTASCVATCSATVDGLVNGRRYRIAVRAVSSAGLMSTPVEAEAVPNVVPAAPTGLRASMQQTQIDLAWSAPSGPVDRYRVTRNGVVVAVTENVWWSDPDVTVDATYVYTVAAENSAGVGPATSGLSVTPTASPTAPTGVAATAVAGQLALSVTWTDPVVFHTGFQVAYATVNNIAAASTVSVGRVSGTTLTGLTGATTYYVWVRSTRGAEVSTPSAVVSATTVPRAPLAVTQSPSTPSTVALEWQASPGATGYRVYVASTDAFPGVSGLVASPATASATVTGLSANTRYFVWVSAVSAVGESPTSSSVPMTTAPAPPTAPTVAGVGGDSTRLAVSWPAAPGASGYRVYSAAWVGATAPSLPAVAETTVSGTSATLTSRTGATRYRVWVEATSATGTSGVSGPGDGFSVPAAPTGVITARPAANTAVLTWTASPGTVTGYEVWRSTTNVFPGGSPVAATATATATINGLTPLATYWFFVKAINAGGASAAAPVTFTNADVPNAPTALTQTAATPASVTVSFTIPGSSSPITNYEYSTDGTTYCALSPPSTASTVTIATRSASSCPGAALAANTPSTVYLRAVSNAGAGDPSAPLSVLTTPAAPTLASVGQTTSQMTPVYTAPGGAGTITGYNYSLDGGATWNSYGPGVTTAAPLRTNVLSRTTSGTTAGTLLAQASSANNGAYANDSYLPAHVGYNRSVAWRGTASNWATGTTRVLASQWSTTSSQQVWQFGLSSSNIPYVTVVNSSGSSFTLSPASALPLTNGQTYWLRADMSVSSASSRTLTARIFYSTSDTNDPSDVTWTQYGTTLTNSGFGTNTTMRTSVAAPTTVSALGLDPTNGFAGTVNRMQVTTTFGNPPVLDFDPSLAAAGSSSVSSVSSASTPGTVNETWTIGTNAAIAAGTEGAPGSATLRGLASPFAVRIRAINAAGAGAASAAVNAQWAGDEPFWSWGPCYAGNWAQLQERGEDRCLVSKSGAVKANWYRASGATGYIVRRYADTTTTSVGAEAAVTGAGSLTATVSGTTAVTYYFEVVSTNAAGVESVPSRRSAMTVSGSRTYNYTGTTQSVTIPAGVTEVRLKLRGAGGGHGGAIPGTYVTRGEGGYGFTASFFRRVNQDQAFNVCVGGAGSSTTWDSGASNWTATPAVGGFNGGGNGNDGGGGGGGSTDLRDSGTGSCNASSSSRRAVAGGGGGGGGTGTSTTGGYGETYRYAGGAGGFNATAGNTGSNGVCNVHAWNGALLSSNILATGGAGGQSTVGGSGGGTGSGYGECATTAAAFGTNGSPYVGGNGFYKGGGGGGGLYGGGAGGGTSSLFALGSGAGGGRGSNGKSAESGASWSNGFGTATLNGWLFSDAETTTQYASGSLCLSWGENTSCIDGGSAGTFGALESVTSPATGAVTLVGWGLDYDSVASTTVTVRRSSTSGAVVGTYNADARRVDVDNARPGVGIYHGYSITLTGEPSGTREYCVTINQVMSSAGTSASFCGAVTVP